MLRQRDDVLPQRGAWSGVRRVRSELRRTHAVASVAVALSIRQQQRVPQ